MTEFGSQRPLPQEQILLQELNHRVNNEFAVAISAVSLAASRSGNSEVKVALLGVAELLHQYADIHRTLQMPECDIALDAETYLQQLCLSISRSYLDHHKIELILSTQPVLLEAGRCWRLGMIVYELIINATRHAFEHEGGEIRVALWRDAGLVKCSVWNSASAAANIQPRRGLQIVDALSKAINGYFEQRVGLLGLTSLVVFPDDSELAVVAGRLRGGAQISERATKPLDDGPEQGVLLNPKRQPTTRTSTWASFGSR